MINITYLPANDPFHAIFRMFVIFPDREALSCSLETARILDFYICFPVQIADFRCPRPLVKLHNSLKKKYAANAYQVTPKPSVLFNRMRGAQGAAANSLQSYGFLDPDGFKRGLVLRTQKPMPDRIHEAVLEHQKIHGDLLEFLGALKALSPFGPDGLRARSGLEEYRYDNV